MEYRQLGRSALRVSKLCLGAMVGFRRDTQEIATKTVDTALDHGVNFIDTADCYGESEEVLGDILSRDGKRDEVVLATKFGWYMGRGANNYGGGRAHVIKACEDSLRKLKTDWIDLYILHVVDPNAPLDELLRALDDLVRQGKVRYLGTSKHPISRIIEALWVSDRLGLERFVSEQPPYNLLDRNAENELIPGCIRHGVGITPFFPLASGLLSGKYRLGQENPEGGRMSRRKPDQDEVFTTAALRAVEKLVPLAEARGVTLAQFSLAWLMQQPGVSSAVVGMRLPQYVESAAAACDVVLTAEELAAVDEIVPPGTYVSNYFEPNMFRALRMGYSSAARRLRAGAFIPDHKTGSDQQAGHR